MKSYFTQEIGVEEMDLGENLPKLKVTRDEALSIIQACINEGKSLLERNTISIDINELQAVRKHWILVTSLHLRDIFHDRRIFKDFENSSEQSYSLIFRPYSESRDMIDSVKNGIEYLGEVLILIPRLTENIESTNDLEATGDNMDKQNIPKKIFIVHGRNHHIRDEIDRFLLREFEEKAEILEESAWEGRSVSEKFEEIAKECKFAICILTADDELFEKGEKPGEYKKILRARQNVILEVGFFWGLLSRRRSLAILIENPSEIEIPSDIEALGYIEITDNLEKMKTDLRKELVAAGFNIAGTN